MTPETQRRAEKKQTKQLRQSGRMPQFDAFIWQDGDREPHTVLTVCSVFFSCVPPGFTPFW